MENNEFNEREYIKKLEEEKHQLFEKKQSLTWENVNKQRVVDKHLREIAYLKAELKRHIDINNDLK